MAKNPRLIDLSDRRFGRWNVVHQAGNHERGGALWHCVCDCGVERIVSGADLRAGKSVSCGCFRAEVTGDLRRSHSASGSRLHGIWKGMRGRCMRQTNPKYSSYGGRGIKICAEWDRFEAFQQWAMSSGYEDHLTIEREDVNGDYMPGNCIWAGAVVQAGNRRNVRRADDGELWLHKARRNGVKDAAFRRRIFDGWPVDEAATVPMNTRRVPRSRDRDGRYT